MDERRDEPANESLCETPAASPDRAAGPPYAACVLCLKPTEYAESVRGITLCPVCEWQEAQRTACSG
ncbi:hypothetical protein E6R60_00270 [Streptomyces sp. A0642]|uniref:hypothetical protein n=1 Tax=unclassified Streptomyces TaxID=2593676 RepID=UPI0010A21D73|nr:hypothetical protein [Streptomyces sp. A0642]THA79011.1 hypothetical protein E6R60_00270 [Streptomyces sp. A0642]